VNYALPSGAAFPMVNPPPALFPLVLPVPDSPLPVTRHHNPGVGIGFKVASVCTLLVMASLLKASEGVPPGQLVFFRSFFAILPIVIVLARSGELIDGLKTGKPMGHVWRGSIGVCAMGLGFFALTKLPLPEAVALGYGMPLLIVVFGAVFLKENVRFHRWSAVVVGLIGVAIISWPRLTVFTTPSGEISQLTVGVLAALISCVFGAFAAMHIRHLVQTERSATIVLYFSIVCTVASLVTIPFGWVAPTPQQWVTLVSAGILGGIGQILLTESYRHADVSVVAPFEYTSLLLSVVVGYFAFGDIPTWHTLIGSMIVIAAGLFIIWREYVLGLERRKQREVTPSTPI
jgi:drug/metabolite transporter (DMT)-like permease